MRKIITLFSVVLLLFSCSSLTSTIKNPDNHIEFEKNDFVFSDQISASADIDFLFGLPLSNTRKSGKFSNGTFQIVGLRSKLSKAEGVAIYKLLKENKGYDIVLYPKFETKSSGFILTSAKVKVTARLGKLKK